VDVVLYARPRTDKLLGVWCLAALDEVARLVELLNDNDPDNADVRETAVHALRSWLARNSHRRETVTELIHRDARGFSRDNAALVVSLLSPISSEGLELPATYQKLIDYLDHDLPSVRNLAYLSLYGDLGKRMPQEALQIDYKPTQKPERRQEAIVRWRKAVPPGKVPVPPAK
jgi:hypothetical protein